MVQKENISDSYLSYFSSNFNCSFFAKKIKKIHRNGLLLDHRKTYTTLFLKGTPIEEFKGIYHFYFSSNSDADLFFIY